jgi:hypothetical protein
MSFIFIVVLRTRKRLTPKDVAAVTELTRSGAERRETVLQNLLKITQEFPIQNHPHATTLWYIFTM